MLNKKDVFMEHISASPKSVLCFFFLCFVFGCSMLLKITKKNKNPHKSFHNKFMLVEQYLMIVI